MTVKTLHIIFAVISIGGFFVRGYLRFVFPSLLSLRWIKIAPHINDTLLFGTALVLVYRWGTVIVSQPWFWVKLLAIVAYIVLGHMVLNTKHSKRMSALAFVGTALLACGIFVVAIGKLQM